jgi:hypothetical protein
MQVKVPKSFMTVSGLLDGFANCARGTQWYYLVELVIEAIYGPQEPSTPTGEDAWKTIFYLDVPFEVEKKFYTLGTHSLDEAKAPVLQSEGTIGWLATF